MTEYDTLKEWLERIDSKLDQAINRDCRERHAALDKELTAMKTKMLIYGGFGVFIASILGNGIARAIAERIF